MSIELNELGKQKKREILKMIFNETSYKFLDKLKEIDDLEREMNELIEE